MKLKARMYLERIQTIDNNIQKDIERLDELRLRYGITSGGKSERVQTSMTADKMTDLICEVTELEEIINSRIDYLNYYKTKAQKHIKELNTDYENLLYQRYFLYESLATMAYDRRTSTGAIKQKIKRALCKLQNVLDNAYKLD